jgi:hypothetical protein
MTKIAALSHSRLEGQPEGQIVRVLCADRVNFEGKIAPELCRK